MALKLPKTVPFLQRFADLSKKPKSIKVISIHLKDLIILFQKIVFFIGVQATIHKILYNKISKKVLTKQKFNKIHQLQTLMPSEL